MNIAEWIVLTAALLGSALYSGLETGVVSVNPLRLQHLVRRGRRGARTLAWFSKHPDHLLGTTLTGTNLCNVILSITSAQIAVRIFGPPGFIVASVATTLGLLVFGEYVPKAWFRSYPAYRVLPWTHFLKISGYVFYPVSMAVMRLARILLPVPANEAELRNPFVSREELSFLAQEGEKYGAFTTEERQRLNRVLALPHKTCGDIMIPRRAMIIVRPQTNRAGILALARKHALNRLPVYDDRQKQFTGVVHIMDVLLSTDETRDQAQAFARPPQYVRADTRIDQALTRMRLNRQPLALIRDSRDVVVGLLTTKDLLDQIIGKV